MLLHKLTERFVRGVVIGTSAVASITFAAGLPEPVIPQVSDRHRQWLSRVARRTVRDAILRRTPYAPNYVPTALGDLTTEVVVRLRQQGYLLASAAAGPKPIALATRDAAATAARMLATGDPPDPARLLIEIEVVGEAQAVPIETDWTQPRAVDPFVEPGVHGLVLTGRDIRHRFCPTELFISGQVLSDALTRLAQATHGSGAEVRDVRLERFRTVHWYQAPGGVEIVSLHRGLQWVPPEAVSPAQLDEAIARVSAYMIYRQLESGLFTYQYEPAKDAYTEGNNLVRQAGATAAMAVQARTSGKSAPLASVDAAIRFHLQGLRPLDGADGAAFIATADERNKLGITALICLALAEHPNPGQYAEVREKLIAGILHLQRPSGMFVTAFPPAMQIDAQDYFPGEALLALAAHYSRQPSARVLDAFDRAVDFYRDYFRGAPSPAFVPWQVQAYARIAKYTKREDYAEYVFELSDWLAAKQLSRANCRWRDMWGGIAAYSDGRAGVATAAYLEGFADALALARSVGDVTRAKHYERVVREAARFVMQLQVRPAEAYFIRSPQDAIGGIRTSPSLNLLRIDHCQHALVGLIKAREVLFPRQG